MREFTRLHAGYAACMRCLTCVHPMHVCMEAPCMSLYTYISASRPNKKAGCIVHGVDDRLLHDTRIRHVGKLHAH